jgi:hypothetical protein
MRPGHTFGLKQLWQSVVLACPALVLLGCQSHTLMPPVEPHVPPLVLKVYKSSETIRLPEPVVIPPDILRSVHVAFDRSGHNAVWPVALPDGRNVTMTTIAVRDGDQLWFAVWIVQVFRADGTLEIQQINGCPDGAKAPWPNYPISWIVYEADGKTRQMEFSWHEDPKTTTFGSATFYGGGQGARHFQVEGDIARELK